MNKNLNLSYNDEISRKKFHLLSLFIPLIYVFQPNYIYFISTLTMIMVIIIDILRIFNIYEIKQLKKILRKYEFKKPMTATYLITIFTIIIYLFDKNIAIYALLVGSICDVSACIYGRIYGKVKIVNNKTLEGTLAFNIFGFFTIFLFYFLIDSNSLIIAPILSVIFASIAELITPGKYDNITTPLSFAIFMKAII